MKRFVGILVAVLLVAGVVYFIVESRNRGELYTESFTGVTAINVNTNLNDVVVREATGDALTMSITGQDGQDFYSVDNGVLSIEVGFANSNSFKISINNKEHQPLHLDIPQGMIDSLIITTTMGSVSLSDVSASDLVADIGSGDIQVVNIPGQYDVQVVSGKLESSLIDATDIEKGKEGQSAVFTGAIGQSDSTVRLATGKGTITIN